MLQATEAVRLRPAAVPPVTVECVTNAFGFTALRHEWDELLRSSAADGPFLTWEWLHAWWAHLRGSDSLCVLAVRAGHDLIALAPLRVSHGPLACFSTVEFLGTGYAGSDYLDVIVRRGHEEMAARAVAKFLRAQKLAVRLTHLAPGSVASQVAAQLGPTEWTCTTMPDGTCPVIPLTGHTWESYLGTRGASHRANIRRRLKGLEQAFQVRFERITAEARRREALDALVAFHDARWEGRGGSSAFLTPALLAFHDEATRRALDRGWLRLYVLRLNDVVAGVMYGFAYNRRFYFYQHGFADQFRAQSVGLALMALTVRAAIDEGTDEFDMLWGMEPYKWLWADQTRLLHQIHLFPTHLGGRMHRGAVGARRSLGRLAKRVLTPGETSAT